MQVRTILVLPLALLGCPSVPAAIDARAPVSSEPPLIVEAAGPLGECSVVAYEGEGLDDFVVAEHPSWADMWRARGLEFEFEDLLSGDAELRAYACGRSEGETGKPACEHAGPLALTLPTESENVLLVVEEYAGGVRSVELGRWPSMCRCDCGAELVRLPTEMLVVVATEYEHVADEVHFEGDEVVPGCDDPATQDCQTACMGGGYGRQQLIVFDEQLRARDRWVETIEGEDFQVEFGLVDDRVVAQRECMQVLVGPPHEAKSPE